MPTEAEWEYAARAGTTSSRYGVLDEIAWYGDNSGDKRIDSKKLWDADSSSYGTRIMGRKTGSMPPTTRRVRRKIRRGRPLDQPACCGAAPGATIRGTLARRTVSTFVRALATSSSASGVVGKTRHLILDPLLCNRPSRWRSAASAKPLRPGRTAKICFRPRLLS